MSKIAPSHTSHRNAPDRLLRLVCVKYTMFQKTGIRHSGPFAWFLPAFLCLISILTGLIYVDPCLPAEEALLLVCLQIRLTLFCFLPASLWWVWIVAQAKEERKFTTWLGCSVSAGLVTSMPPSLCAGKTFSVLDVEKWEHHWSNVQCNKALLCINNTPKDFLRPGKSKE